MGVIRVIGVTRVKGVIDKLYSAYRGYVLGLRGSRVDSLAPHSSLTL